MNKDEVKKRIKTSIPTTFQEPLVGYLGKSSDADAEVIAGQGRLYARIGDPDTPEYEIVLISPFLQAYYWTLLRPNAKAELVKTARGDLKVWDFDVYQQIEYYADVYPQPNIIVDLSGNSVVNILPVGKGGTGANLGSTGGSNQVVKQSTSGGAFTVGALVNAEIPATLSGKTFTGNTVSDFLAFTEASTPSNPSNNAMRLFGRDVLNFSRMGYLDSTGLLIDISRDRTTEVNNPGSALSALAVVRVNGASGSTPFQPTVTLAQADSAANADGVLGVVIAAISGSANGRVMLHGRLENVNTSALSVGAVYIDPTTPGALTNTAPTAPDVARRVGFVLRSHLTAGVLLVDPGELGDSSSSIAVFTGATSGDDGAEGLVPAPLTGEQDYILTGDGTWKNTMDDVTIGGTTPADATFVGLVSQPDGNTRFSIESGIQRYTYAAANGVGAILQTRKARGNYGAPGQVLSGDVLTAWYMQSYGTSNYGTATIIQAVATENQTDSARGSKIEFYTSPNGNLGGLLAATIGQDKSLTMNNAPVIVGISYFGVSAGSNAGNDRLWQDSTDKMLAWQTASGLKMLPGGVFWKMISAVGTTATTEASLTDGTTWGTLTIPANTAIAGTYFEFDFSGLVVASAGRLRIVFRLNGALVASHQTGAITSGAARNFSHRMTMKVLNTSGTNNLIVIGEYNSENGGHVVNNAIGTGNFDPASSNTFTFFAYFDTTPSGQSVTFHTGIGKIF